MRIPGAWCLFVWGLVTAVIPLGLATAARPVEEARFGGPEMTWWIVGASVIPAAVAAARHPRGRSSFGMAMAAGLLAAALYAGATAAVYEFVFPMEKHPIGLPILLAIGPALAGAAIGRTLAGAAAERDLAGAAIGPASAAADPAPAADSARAGATAKPAFPSAAAEPAFEGAAGKFAGRQRKRSTKTMVAAGFAVALAGALLTPGTVEDAAQFSLARPTGAEPGVQQPSTILPEEPGVQQPSTFLLPEPGRYTLMADGLPPANPGCRLSGPGGVEVPAEPLTVQPTEPGYDATPATTTLADVDVDVAGAYTLACSSGGDADYYLAGGWTISRIADAVMRWPLPVLLLIGALPGLAIIAAAARRRTLPPAASAPS